jgi:deazaflavin-dependent oxidoreductase (nitroreductase family)
MADETRRFDRPAALDRWFSRVYGALVGAGIGFAHNFVLEVRGRKSGRLYSTPVDVVRLGPRRYLVAPRGETQWVRNARSTGRVTLRKGSRSEELALRELGDAEKPEVLKAYLDAFKRSVQRFFPVPAGSPRDAFVPLAPDYPAFELVAKR